MSSPIITAREARALSKARDILEGVVDRCKESGWSVADQSYTLGMIAAIADQAEEAIFDVLNCMSAFAGSKIASAEIHRRMDEREAARQVAAAEREKVLSVS